MHQRRLPNIIEFVMKTTINRDSDSEERQETFLRPSTNPTVFYKTIAKKNVSYSFKEENIAKSMTVLKLFKRSSKWDHAGCCSFIRLEMTEG